MAATKRANTGSVLTVAWLLCLPGCGGDGSSSADGGVADLAGADLLGAATDLASIDALPMPGPTPALLEDFSTYLDTADLLANPRGIWASSEGSERDRIVLDTTVGYGASSRSMRYDFPNLGSVCQDYGVRLGMLELPPGLTHVWVEYVVRFSTNFTVNAGRNDCAAEYKLASMGDYGGIGRWNIPEMQTGQWVMGYPFIIGTEDYSLAGFDPAEIWDGQPHVFRVEAKLGKGAADGRFKMWIDGAVVADKSGIESDPSHDEINYFGPGLNMNQGPSVSDLQLWWHRIALYTSDPGW